MSSKKCKNEYLCDIKHFEDIRRTRIVYVYIRRKEVFSETRSTTWKYEDKTR